MSEFNKVYENVKAKYAGRKTKQHKQMLVVLALKNGDNITKDKRYLVSDENEDSYVILNDKDTPEAYDKDLFKVVDKMSGKL